MLLTITAFIFAVIFSTPRLMVTGITDIISKGVTGRAHLLLEASPYRERNVGVSEQQEVVAVMDHQLFERLDLALFQRAAP